MEEPLSTSSSNAGAGHRLGWVQLVLSLLVLAVGGELVGGWLLWEDTRFLAKLREYLKTEDSAALVLFGACFAEELPEDRMRASLGGEVNNLSSAASTPLDWYLATRVIVESGPKPGAIVVAWAAGDLELVPLPWSAQSMELMNVKDVIEISQVSCKELSCGLELGWRKISRVYRYRGYLGRQVWSLLRVPQPSLAPQNVVQVGANPSLFRGVFIEPPEGANAPARLGDLKDWVGPLSRPASESGEGWLQAGDDPFYWFRRLVALANEAQIPVYTYAIPSNPADEARFQVNMTRGRLTHTVITGIGAHVLEPNREEISAGHFRDEAHLTSVGSAIVAENLGTRLRDLR